MNLESTVSLLHLVGDGNRVRLLALLAREELTVAELVDVTQLSQSRVSTHLGRLRDAGLLRDRKHRASRYYTLNEEAMPGAAKRLWSLISEDVDDAVLEGDRRRCAELLKARSDRGNWPDAIAGAMERHYSPGRTWEATARGLLGLLRLGRVLDVGAGDGATSELLLPVAERVTLLDRSDRVLDAAKKRLARYPNVEFALGDMHELPFPRGAFDQVLLFNSLQYSDYPERAVKEAARVLAPGGTLVVVTLYRHRHQSVTDAYGHVNAGFGRRQLRQLLTDANLLVDQCDRTSRERRSPHFEVVTAFAHQPANS